ncbi:hypothetical protein DEO72_LG5g1358 [Vigna unguiculata]|uniref:Uncharacterized protein n=1 Tax=Vigna unguiculata TaxID=3917 RepID=A0A4D6LZ91_VIGUN|nr:hypothetical protein DEO72_LG5g1358 [Vigna unguiculata]
MYGLDLLTLEPVRYVSHFPFLFLRSLSLFLNTVLLSSNIVHCFVVLAFQHSPSLCEVTVVVTVQSHRRRDRAKSPLSSLCEVAITVTMRSRSRRHRVKSPSSCEVATTVRRSHHHAKSPRHGRVLFLCSASASIIVALCYLRCQNTWSPSLCRPHCPFSPFEGQHLNPNHRLLLFC